MPAASIEEEYTPFNHQDYQTIVGKIKRFASGGQAAVLSTINGDSNVPFYKEFANQGLRSENAPIMAFSVAEDELRGMDTSALVGHLAAWNYYQSVDTPQNKKFVSAFKEYAQKNNLPGGTKRVTDDPMEAGYFGVVPGTNAQTNPTAMEMISHDTIYTNVALLPDGDVWWEGKSKEPPAECLDWAGKPWAPGCGRPNVSGSCAPGTARSLTTRNS